MGILRKAIIGSLIAGAAGAGAIALARNKKAADKLGKKVVKSTKKYKASAKKTIRKVASKASKR